MLNGLKDNNSYDMLGPGARANRMQSKNCTLMRCKRAQVLRQTEFLSQMSKKEMSITMHAHQAQCGGWTAFWPNIVQHRRQNTLESAYERVLPLMHVQE
jgi:hypothetical protein